MDPDGNWRVYRKTLSQATSPCIPYLGTVLTDLTFTEDGNQDNINDLVNFKKRDLLHETIVLLKQYQKLPFQFEIKEPFFTFLQELTFLDDKELWEVSNFLEPKEKLEKNKFQTNT